MFGVQASGNKPVHLNPKQELQPAGAALNQVPHASAADYIEAHRHFGERSYGPGSPGTHRSPFDAKQIKFLRPFNVIDFSADSTSPADRQADLVKVVDGKLQLELIPYGSPSFPTGKLSANRHVLRPDIE